uniref:Uncharacterized protein n=1 Tax=mine drainage metagenome TaxID=410659 RepID=E6Q9T2_9ZZZZ
MLQILPLNPLEVSRSLFFVLENHAALLCGYGDPLDVAPEHPDKNNIENRKTATALRYVIVSYLIILGPL